MFLQNGRLELVLFAPCTSCPLRIIFVLFYQLDTLIHWINKLIFTSLSAYFEVMFAITQWMMNEFQSVHRSVVSDPLWPHESQHARPPCPSPTPRVYPNSCLSSRWCHPAISSSVVPFSSCPQSLRAFSIY